MMIPSTSNHLSEQQGNNDLNCFTLSTSTNMKHSQKENECYHLNTNNKRKKGPGRPSKQDMIERAIIQEKKDKLRCNKKLKTMHTTSGSSNDNNYNMTSITENHAYYAKRVGDQVVAFKRDQEKYFYGRIVDLSPSLIFVHFEGWPPDQADWIEFHNILTCQQINNQISYGPKGKESKASWEDYKTFYYSSTGIESRKNTGLVSDAHMSLHDCPCQSQKVIHPERPDRITSIFEALHAKRLLRYFRRIQAREVTSDELLRVHTFCHVRNYYPLLSNVKSDPKPIKITSIAALLNYSPPSSPILKPQISAASFCGVGGGPVVKLEQCQLTSSSSPELFMPPDLLYKMDCGELGIAVDTTYHPMHSRKAAKLSAGGLIELSDAVVRGELKNGFALIRPPGHHAEDDAAMGYCFYNNIAVAVSATMEKHPTLIKKVLIIDWDIHHGNGTQKIFYDNPNVLYISVHRWEHGTFYPFTGAPDECGQSEGLGSNINIALNESKEKPKSMGDTEFIAAFYHLLIPIARQFQPDMIFVSAGFDAAEGHPENLGGYNVTPKGFSLMTKIVCDLAKELCNDRLVMSLEGGYELESLSNSATASMAQLLSNNTTFKHSLTAIKPNLGAIESFRTIVDIHKKYWNQLPSQPNFKFQLPSDWKATDSIATRPKRDKRGQSLASSSGGY